MKVYVYIQQKPLKVKTYTSLTALYLANKSDLSVSKSTLEKYNFDSFDYVTSRVIISKTEPQTTGDIYRESLQKVVAELKDASSKAADSQKEWKKACELSQQQKDGYKKMLGDLDKEIDDLLNN
ncbi:MAG: hypothetical protein ACK5KN_05880 [Dysgonomonas sp.]|uniref:hypothetical protein n=1 Tax=Dysgonomonas sp. TaxID=1891233 RepID=UPI003A872053